MFYTKKKNKKRKIQEVWEEVIHNLESEAEIEEILLLWADESGSECGSRSELPPKWRMKVFVQDLVLSLSWLGPVTAGRNCPPEWG